MEAVHEPSAATVAATGGVDDGANETFTPAACGSKVLPVTLICSALRQAFGAGVVMVRSAARVSSVTGNDVVVVLPVLSVATTLMVLLPSSRVTLQVKVPVVIVAAVPLHVTPAMPVSASLTVPLMASDGLATIAPLAGVAMVSTGAVVSSVICTLAELVVFDVSVAVAVMVFAPSPLVRVIVAVHALFVVPFVSTASVPLTFTFATATSSLAVPLTVTLLTFVKVPLTGEVM